MNVEIGVHTSATATVVAAAAVAIVEQSRGLPPAVQDVLQRAAGGVIDLVVDSATRGAELIQEPQFHLLFAVAFAFLVDKAVRGDVDSPLPKGAPNQ